MRTISAANLSFLNPLRWEYPYECRKLKTNKDKIYIENREYQSSNWHKISLANEYAKTCSFYQDMTILLADIVPFLNPC